MKKTGVEIKGIPAVLWGDASKELFIAVHGNASFKDDEVIKLFAEEAIQKGYGVLSFDLPKHGERKDEEDLCSVQNGVKDLAAIYEYAQTIGKPTGLFGCSIGAYFSLLSYKEKPFKQCVFLSPVVDMERIIHNMMTWFEISEERLQAEKEIETPIGETLYWDYYCYVKANPVDRWDKPTEILYGSKDTVCEIDTIEHFVNHNQCKLSVMIDGEHHFHTIEQIQYYRQWLAKSIL